MTIFRHQLNRRSLIYGGIAAGLLIGGGAGAGVIATSSNASSSAIAQTITVPCPSSVQVTPALNANLVSNPGAESTTPFPASYGLSAAQANEQEPDCWTISSQSTNPGGILSALPYVPPTGNGQSSKPANPATTDPNKGNNLFYGGITTGPTSADSNVFTFGTQTVSLSGLGATGQKFELSAYLGGTTTQTDFADVSVSFQNSQGQALEPNVPFEVGPVTPAMRGSKTSLIPEETTGVVPVGAATAVVTITTEQVGGGPADDDGMADDINLTIGSSVTPVSTLTTLPYTFPAGSGGSLVQPRGISAWHGQVYVSNTADNLVASLNGSNTTPVAGSLETIGENGDGGQATSAGLTQPAGTVKDGANLYIADSENNVIRRVNIQTGVITRFAGTGDPGSAGIGGPAKQAQLDAPQAVAVDAQGDLFIADTDNNRVDEVLPNGNIVAFAGNGTGGYAGDGGQAAAAELNEPSGVAVDAAGNVYIADSSNNVIRRVDSQTGVITTVAGNVAADQANDGLGGFSGDGGPATSAQLYDPQGIAIDGAGDLFIADTFNHAIREVTPNGIISTVVNSASAGGATPARGGETDGLATASRLDGPTGVAVDDTTGSLYIADTSNSKAAAVSGLVMSGSAPGPVAPGTQ
jgi:sugar lactone lactonase YvrE